MKKHLSILASAALLVSLVLTPALAMDSGKDGDMQKSGEMQSGEMNKGDMKDGGMNSGGDMSKDDMKKDGDMEKDGGMGKM